MVVRLGYLRSFIVENFLSFKNNVDLLLGDLKKNILERFRLCTLKLLQLLEMHRRLEYVLFQKNNINISKIVFFTNL